MSTNPRDTQFAGFVRLLAEESAKLPIDLEEPVEVANQRFQLLIAQRTHDLIKHVFDVMPYLVNNANIASLDQAMAFVPDMTEWPEEQQ